MYDTLPDLRLSTQTSFRGTWKGVLVLPMNTVDGDVSLGDAPPPSSPDAHVQGQQVHGPSSSVAGRLLFASVVTGLDRLIDPGVPQGLGVPNEPANDMMLPNLTASAKASTTSTTAPRQQRTPKGR